MYKKTMLVLIVLMLMSAIVIQVYASEGVYRESLPGDYNDFYYYFHDAYWVRSDANTRDGWALKVYPTDVLRRLSGGRNSDAAFSHLMARFGDDYRWTDSDSIRKQLKVSVTLQKSAEYWLLISR